MYSSFVWPRFLGKEEGLLLLSHVRNLFCCCYVEGICKQVYSLEWPHILGKEEGLVYNLSQ